jgi:hypothetical protein
MLTIGAQRFPQEHTNHDVIMLVLHQFRMEGGLLGSRPKNEMEETTYAAMKSLVKL